LPAAAQRRVKHRTTVGEGPRDDPGPAARRLTARRASARTTLYQAARNASRFNPVLRALYQRLRQAGKPP
jgi:hypothetical protein